MPNLARDDIEQTGICLSGGGLRAASFSLGVLQVLQRKRGLLYGADAAAWLSAVSGGSYTAGAHVLGGRERAVHPERYEDEDPLAEGSKEEEHILGHGRYLLAAPWRWPTLGLLTFGSLVVLFAWAGFMLADAAALAIYLPDDVEGRVNEAPSVLAVAAVFVAVGLVVRGLYSESHGFRALYGFTGIVLLWLGSRPAIEWATALNTLSGVGQALRTAGWLVLLLVALAAATLVLRKLRVVGLPASALNIASTVTGRVLGLVLIGAVAIEWYPHLRSVFAEEPGAEYGRLGLAFAVTLGAPLLLGGLPSRASLHREYRRRLESCFSVARDANGDVQELRNAPLSLPPPTGGPERFPRLLICATANVRRRGPDGRRWTFLPFVLTHDRCAVPGDDHASFSTEKLELGRVPAGVLTRRKEPLVSLFTAVAATGAAVSPSMGRFTVASVRALIAVLNVRLGRWIPNPYSSRALRAVENRTAPGTFDRVKRLGSGYDELIPEMLGMDGPRVYLSDGGHYDNLGLVSLLRHRPDTVWCVDASPDRTGKAAELRRVLELARVELEVEITLDCDVFRRLPNGYYGATHSVGQIAFPGRPPARLVVLKLGLTSDSDPQLQARQRRFGFPFHPTARQVYDADRIDAYLRVGREVAMRALDDGAAVGESDARPQ